MKHFADKRFRVDVLKMEVTVDMDFVEGYTEGEYVYTQREAAALFKDQSEGSDIPYIFLSAGVSAELFQETLKLAKSAGAEFHGLLCGRATWSGAANVYKEAGEKQAISWLQQEGKNNITKLNDVLKETATDCGY